MAYILCMNKLKDYGKWRTIFDSHKEAHIKAGFHLESIWRLSENAGEVYFIFSVDDKEKADAFFNSPYNASIAQEAGVIDGWIKYVDELNLY